MATQLNVVNCAAGLLGKARLSSFPDSSVASGWFNEQWDNARRAALRSHPWNFATKTAYIGENLLLQSEAFGTTWTPTDASVSSNSTYAPNGELTADTLVDASANAGTIVQAVTVANSIDSHTFSVYLKQSTAAITTVSMVYSGGSGASLSTNITWGATPTLTNGALTQVGGGWWRLVMTLANIGAGDTTLTITIYPASSTAASQGNVFAWGAQLTMTASAVGYVKTTTAASRLIYPSNGFGYGLPLPTDYLAIIDVDQGDFEYKIESGYLLYQSSSAPIRYIWDQTTVSAWDDMFVQAMGSHLAEMSCVAITGSDAKLDMIVKYRKSLFAGSRNRDSQEDGQDYPKPDAWVEDYLS